MGTSTAKRQVWIDHVTAWAASGQTQRAYCAQHELSYPAFDYWRRFVLKQDTPPQAAFLPVVALAPSAPGCGGVIEVRLVGGARLRLACETAGIQLRTLQRWKAVAGAISADGRPLGCAGDTQARPQ